MFTYVPFIDCSRYLPSMQCTRKHNLSVYSYAYSQCGMKEKLRNNKDKTKTKHETHFSCFVLQQSRFAVFRLALDSLHSCLSITNDVVYECHHRTQ